MDHVYAASFLTVEVYQCFTTHFRSRDLEVLSHLMKALYTYDFVLDILSLHLKISDIVFEAIQLLNEYDCETVGS